MPPSTPATLNGTRPVDLEETLRRWRGCRAGAKKRKHKRFQRHMGKERSSGNKTDELRVLIKTHGCSVMRFMETWLTHTLPGRQCSSTGLQNGYCWCCLHSISWSRGSMWPIEGLRLQMCSLTKIMPVCLHLRGLHLSPSLSLPSLLINTFKIQYPGTLCTAFCMLNIKTVTYQ